MALEELVHRLEKACDTRTWTTVSLPSGRRVLVCPEDDFSALQTMFSDPDLRASFDEAVDDLRNKRGRGFAKGERPR